MKFFTFAAVFSFLIAVSFCSYAPASSPCPTPSAVAAYYTKVIGQSSFFSDDDLDINSYTIYDPYSLRYVPSGRYGATGGKFFSGGLLAIDTDAERVLFFPNPIATTLANASFVFNQPDFTSNEDDGGELGDTDFADITYDNTTLYILADSEVYSYYAVNAYGSSYPNHQLYYNASFGNGGAVGDADPSYQPLEDSYYLQYDYHSQYIYVSDPDCGRIVYWASDPAGDTVPPVGVIGQSDTLYETCDDCEEDSSYQCIDSPGALTFDCYGGLWVNAYDDESEDGVYSIYYYPAGSKSASFGIQPTDGSDDFEDLTALAFDLKSCNYLAAATGDYVYIFQISFSGTTANFPSAVYYYGGGDDDGPTNSTNSLNDIYGVAWDYDNEGYLFVSDYENDRIVYFNALSAAPTPSTAASQSRAGSSAGSSAGASSTSTPTASLSFGASPSNTNTPTASLSFGSSPSNSAPQEFESSFGAGSCLVSWLF